MSHPRSKICFIVISHITECSYIENLEAGTYREYPLHTGRRVAVQRS